MHELKTIPEDLFATIAHFTWNKRWKRDEILDLATRIADIQDSIPDVFKSYWYTDPHLVQWWRFPNPLLSGQPFYPADLTQNHWNRRHAYCFLKCVNPRYFRPKLKRPLFRHFARPLYREWNKFFGKIRDLEADDFRLPNCMIPYHVPDFHHVNSATEQASKLRQAQAANRKWCLRFLEQLELASVTLKPS